MPRKQDATSAQEILLKRYVRGEPEKAAALEAERVHADVAQMIYDLRAKAGLTQKELAGLVGTTQSVVSRLEDGDYRGHSLSMLTRIAEALDQRLTVAMTPRSATAGRKAGAGTRQRHKALRSRRAAITSEK